MKILSYDVTNLKKKNKTKTRHYLTYKLSINGRQKCNLTTQAQKVLCFLYEKENLKIYIGACLA